MHPAALYQSYRAEPLKSPEPQRFSGFSLFGVCAGFPEGDTKGDTWDIVEQNFKFFYRIWDRHIDVYHFNGKDFVKCKAKPMEFPVLREVNGLLQLLFLVPKAQESLHAQALLK